MQTSVHSLAKVSIFRSGAGFRKPTPAHANFSPPFLRVLRGKETQNEAQFVIPVQAGIQVIQRKLVPRLRGEDTYSDFP